MRQLDQLGAGLKRASAAAAQLLPDVLMLAGAGAISYGAWLTYPAAGFVVAGAFSLTAGVLSARKAVA